MNIAPPMGVGGPPRNSLGQLNNTQSNIQPTLHQGSPGPRMFAPPPSSVGPPPPSSVGLPPSSMSTPLLNGPSGMPPQSVPLYANTSATMVTSQPPHLMGTRQQQQQPSSPPQMQQQIPSQQSPPRMMQPQQQSPPRMMLHQQQPPPPSQQQQQQQQPLPPQQQQMYNVRAPPPGGTMGVGPPPMNRSPRPPMPGPGIGGIGPPPRGPDPQFRNSPGPNPPGMEPAANFTQGPPSQKSSRAPSPIANQSYDALEGQFTCGGQQQPMVPQGLPAAPPQGLPGPPPKQGGITGKRQYPQMPSMTSTPASSPPSQTYSSVTAGMPPQPPLPPTGMNQSYSGDSMNNQPQSPHVTPYCSGNMANLNANFSNLSTQEYSDVIDLMQQRQLIGVEGVETPASCLPNEFSKSNVSSEIFRCTLMAIPQTSALLNKSRLPLGVIIHPFKDLTSENNQANSQLPVITSTVIVRCRTCRTYINPFISFVDRTRWKCNLCYRVNELPEEFSFDPVSRTYGDPQRRPEVRSSTIEFIAPSEYMLRPPQPAVYLFVLDVTFNAIGTGYLSIVCKTLLSELDKLPGDSRTQIGFIAFDQAIHFFNLAEGLSQPQMLTVSDIDEIFLPLPDSLLVNLHESRDLVEDLLRRLPELFANNMETGNALGAALQASFKLLSPTGGRVTVFQTCLPTAGPGTLQMREDNNANKGAGNKNVPHLGPATDFYKKLALDCSAQQIAMDVFMLNGQYADLATVACVSKYSGGCLYHYPSFHTIKNPSIIDKFETDLARYVTRKIGFEAVMRIRCTRGLSIHTFHGNFFVRSTDLLSLPNINPDAGFGMQVSIEDSLTESNTACFQAALLYTSSKGERRIRVHTLCLPVTTELSVVHATADQQAIAALLAKMAVDRTLTSSLGDARDALINAGVDALSSFSNSQSSSSRMGSLPCPFSLRLLPLYILALLKSKAFRGARIGLDERVFNMEQCKTLPMCYLLQKLYPSLYPLHNLDDEHMTERSGINAPWSPILQLTAANLDRHGAYLLDALDSMVMLIGGAISDQFCQDVFDFPNFSALPDGMTTLPEKENAMSERVRTFVYSLMDARPNGTTFIILREDSKRKHLFFQHFVEDRTESTMSYYEFIQHIQKHAKG